eukprot:SAG31_NODE_19187_length_609_cov_64.509804_2_plen_77_part_01
MYKSPELQEATDKLINCARDRNILLGMFQVSVCQAGELQPAAAWLNILLGKIYLFFLAWGLRVHTVKLRRLLVDDG